MCCNFLASMLKMKAYLILLTCFLLAYTKTDDCTSTKSMITWTGLKQGKPLSLCTMKKQTSAICCVCRSIIKFTSNMKENKVFVYALVTRMIRVCPFII